MDFLPDPQKIYRQPCAVHQLASLKDDKKKIVKVRKVRPYHDADDGEPPTLVNIRDEDSSDDDGDESLPLGKSRPGDSCDDKDDDPPPPPKAQVERNSKHLSLR
jgi:hypothetical protein